MKRCSVCSRTYADDTLNFCLEDGTPLESYLTEYPTEIIPGGLSTAPAPATSQIQANSIAVLPFAHLSSDPDDEYFCDGLAEELLNALARIDGLKVAARTSSFYFKGKDVTISEVGRVLGVETVLEGSVRKSGDRLRVTAQLINASDGYHLWSERYDSEMRDVFDLQDEITTAVIKALKVQLLGKEEEQADQMAALIEQLKDHSRDLQAYQLYLRGRYFLNKFTTADALRAVKVFEEALEREPRLALAHAGLADAYIMLTGMGPMQPHEAMPKAKEFALRAIALDDTLAEAHSSLAMILQEYEFQFAAAESEFLRAIELSPNNPIPHQSYAILLTELGRHEEAAIHFRKLFEVDPLSVVGHWIFSFCLFLARRYDESLAAAERTLELDPNFGVAYLSVAFAYQMKGEYEKSVEAYARSAEVMGYPENAAFVRSRFEDGWEAFLGAMASDERPMSFSFYIIAVFKAALGDIDGAFAELERSLEKRESHIVMVKCDPRFDALRGDSRFPLLLDRIGF
jgi:TolB-like protein/Tfp pilus assembly protein PilF